MNLEGHWLITGGAGFLARALYRRARNEGWRVQFTALSRDDAKHVALRGRFPEIHSIRGDVAALDVGQLSHYMRGMDGVIHMAAVKYVHLAELSALETTRVNVLGSANVFMAALNASVPTVVAISTDKAVEPANIYGATKMVMERLCSQSNFAGGVSRFVNVRYGNVVASTGSVIPVFRKQLAEHGRILITDGSMTRFWLPVDHALDTILYAVDRGAPGTTTIPLCNAMNVTTLAHLIAGDAGKIEIVGPRPGEKRHELLLGEHEVNRAFQIRSGFAGFTLFPPEVDTSEIDDRWLPAEGPYSSADAPPVGGADMRTWIEDSETV